MEQDDTAVSHWERVAQEYSRQIESLRKLEVEVTELRPLVLKNALLQQEISQIREDKEDWKAYATRLSDQLQENNIIPLPFRRTPHDGDTMEKLKTISQKMQTIKQESEANKSAAVETPTLVFPPAEK